MSEATEYVLPAELRQSLLAYLSSRPYAEVVHGIQALQSLKPVSLSNS